MSKERELLARCLEHLEWVTEFPEGDDMEEVAEEIRTLLATPEPYKRTTPLDALEICAIYYAQHPDEGNEFSALVEAFAEGVRAAEQVYGVKDDDA